MFYETETSLNLNWLYVFGKENSQERAELSTDSAVFYNWRDESGGGGNDFQTLIFLHDEVADQRILL